MFLLPKMKILSRLNLLRNKSVAPVLSGINPSNLDENHLWKKLISSENLEQAFDWLCQKTPSASAHSDVYT